MHSDSRSKDRVHYTMKTARSAPPIPLPSPHASSHPYRTSKSGTPLGSPRLLAHSVGQPYPPKSSPGLANRPSPGGMQDARCSSPNYFGLVIEPVADHRDPTTGRGNWSPASSSVKSFAAALPKQLIPLDANPAYDAFRRQADAAHSGRLFNLGTHQLGKRTTAPQTDADVDTAVSPLTRSWLSVRPSHGPTVNDTTRDAIPEVSWSPNHGPGASKMDIDTDVSSMHDSAYASADSNRNSDTSLEHTLLPTATICDSQFACCSETPPMASQAEDRISPLPSSLGLSKLAALAGAPTGARLDKLAAMLDTTGINMITADELKRVMETDTAESPSLLLLDVRVSTYYAVSRIRGALNLCIPTTLLKRATFNLQKMQTTFAHAGDQAKFAAWREAQYLVVYDSSSAEKRDAVAATNMLRKFINEGYKGRACILHGGFKAFEAAHPKLIDRQPSAAASAGSSALSLNAAGRRPPTIAPIIGGVMIPITNAAPTPFFSNIRQNMDLADGVGRLDITLPANLDTAALPPWLRAAMDPQDHGQRVSERFLGIELAEQSRMKHAYAAFNPSACTPGATGNVQLSGVEKGAKNRYKDILPFEHSRVRLAGRADDDCDYVNASHIQASCSKKRYIASQGPLPATFEDFWTMIWEQDVRVIVMLTAESEGGQLKCHPYWTNRQYGATKLRMLSEKKVSLDMEKHRSNSTISNILSASGSPPVASSASDFRRRRANTLTALQGHGGSASSTPSYGGPLGASAASGRQDSETPFVVIRKFALSHGRHPFEPMREITQLHFAAWPDFGAPAKPSHLLALVQLADIMQRSAPPPDGASTSSSRAKSPPSKGMLEHAFWPWSEEPETIANTRPMLVHCSAGCGRTGTFCTVDAVIDMLKQQRHRAHGLGNICPAGAAGESTAWLGVPRSESAASHGNNALVSDVSTDLIAKTVEDFRTQRLSMVQSLRQFVLCYETVAEWIAKTEQRQGAQSRGQGRARSESLRLQSFA